MIKSFDRWKAVHENVAQYDVTYAYLDWSHINFQERVETKIREVIGYLGARIKSMKPASFSAQGPYEKNYTYDLELILGETFDDDFLGQMITLPTVKIENLSVDNTISQESYFDQLTKPGSGVGVLRDEGKSNYHKLKEAKINLSFSGDLAGLSNDQIQDTVLSGEAMIRYLRNAKGSVGARVEAIDNLAYIIKNGPDLLTERMTQLTSGTRKDAALTAVFKYTLAVYIEYLVLKSVDLKIERDDINFNTLEKEMSEDVSKLESLARSYHQADERSKDQTIFYLVKVMKENGRRLKRDAKESALAANQMQRLYKISSLLGLTREELQEAFQRVGTSASGQ